MDSVTYEDITDAAQRLSGILRATPPIRARWLEDLVGGEVYLIPENLQRAGSFKVRGAYNRIAQLSDAEKSKGVVAASAGNHAQGVALAAQTLGIPATVFMPADASIPKVQATIGYGAEVQLTGATIGDAIDAALEFAQRTGAVVVHPYDNADVVAGQGTLGVEISRAIPDVATVVACTGGGGLLAGLAVALRHDAPNARLVGAQAERAAAFPESLAAGKPITRTDLNSMADGIAVGTPGDIPFAIIAGHQIPIVTVSEEEISRAVLLLLERSKMLVEPGGAAAVAAVMANPASFTPPIAITLSGGNVDPLILARILRHGLASAGRYLTVTVRAPDRPGALAAVLAVIQELRGNVVEVDHSRSSPDLGVDEVEIVIEVETRGPQHSTDIINAINASGVSVVTAGT
jgi:threonine dehydratase